MDFDCFDQRNIEPTRMMELHPVLSESRITDGISKQKRFVPSFGRLGGRKKNSCKRSKDVRWWPWSRYCENLPCQQNAADGTQCFGVPRTQRRPRPRRNRRALLRRAAVDELPTSRLGGPDHDVVFGQGFRSLQAGFVRFHFLPGEADSVGVFAVQALHDRMLATPPHP